MTNERTGIVSAKGNPLTLVGTPLEVGQKAPDVQIRDSANKPADLAATGGGWRIFVTVPSLDTGVCEAEAKRLNEEAGKLADKVKVVLVSRDLPQAQGRFCKAHDATNIATFSDFDKASLGHAWGIYIKENGLLARTVAILDADNTVRYLQVVPELPTEPNYDEVLGKVKELVG